MENKNFKVMYFTKSAKLLLKYLGLATRWLEGMALDYTHWMAGIDMGSKTQDKKIDFE